ncbi:conjugal transfer protein MobB [Rhabdobacter roseus]|uniref:MobA/VirD2-like nuclease domain-containing protein n=1 Tax=Rhabdobacter roseus TaxID=1655419 RepID=A0A840TI54_9BACT|nr:relaxase/mobilization nuclease domain-containing protein [Rhabdobacter roseus]MBB5282981.1 hypothetical protein [Rhabdobacter roseus]
MVARIGIGKNLRAVLLYNEGKVARQEATLLEAGYYPKEVAGLTFHEKWARLQQRMSLNPRVKANVLHISLNFAPGENLPPERLTDIAVLYLDKIGFADQPFLLYEHHDAAHPHVHLVTTNIRADGRRISLHNIGRIRSEKARKEIQAQFGLVKAEDRPRLGYEPPPVRVEPAAYGKAETKRALSQVLRHVLPTYRYSSLPELNAVLRQYQVRADRGSEDSRLYQKGGLVYRILDAAGNPVGVPMKASAFSFKPTLTYLSGRFAENQATKRNYRARLKNTIDLALLEKPTWATLSRQLEHEGVRLVERSNDQGRVYGLTYVDHRTRCVFNGSELGKPYTVQGLRARCGSVPLTQPPRVSVTPPSQESSPRLPGTDFTDRSRDDGLLEALTLPLPDPTGVPWPLRKKMPRKRRRISQP